MDDRMLAGVSRSLATGAPRRAALRLLAGGLAAAALGGTRPRPARAYPATCTRFVLSGGRGITDPIHADDDLRVTVAGRAVLDDCDGGANIHPSVWFEGRRGDTLRVVARDAQAPSRGLSDLWLHCRENNGGSPVWVVQGRAKTTASKAKWERWRRRSGGVFVDETHTL